MDEQASGEYKYTRYAQGITRLGCNLYEGVTDEQDYLFYLKMMDDLFDIDLEEIVERTLCQG